MLFNSRLPCTSVLLRLLLHTGGKGNAIKQDTNTLKNAQGNVTGKEPRYYL